MRRIPGSPGLLVGGSLLVLIATWATWQHTRTFDPPAVTSVGYAPRIGDVVFQSLPMNDFVRMIETATASRLSHCGIVALDRGRGVVIEAIGPVRETALEVWIRRGRGRRITACRPREAYAARLAQFVASARRYLDRPYDRRFRMDDERIYCSELVYKAFRATYGEAPARPVRLRNLRWARVETLIRRYEGGPAPLDREIITPRDLARAPVFERVFPRPSPRGAGDAP